MGVSYEGSERPVLAAIIVLGMVIVGGLIIVFLERHDRQETVRSCVEAGHAIEECQNLVKTMNAR